MSEKICFKCGVKKDLSEYYKHKQMRDGHLNKCKNCTKKDTKNRCDELLKDPNWVECERERHRSKYYRLGYKEKHRPSNYYSVERQKKYRSMYPEKNIAKSRVNKSDLVSNNGNFHHWSYNDEHFLDIVDISIKDHAKAHRFIIYDQERKMYRRCDNGELLDTKEKHKEWIYWCIKNKKD
jgi:hypothetical protein